MRSTTPRSSSGSRTSSSRKDDKLFTRVTVSIRSRAACCSAGSVDSPDDRVDVARLTWQVDGVKEVFNEVEVRDRAGVIDYFRDVRIANELRLKLLTDKEVSAVNYSVEAVNGVIFLMGIGAETKPNSNASPAMPAISRASIVS